LEWFEVFLPRIRPFDAIVERFPAPIMGDGVANKNDFGRFCFIQFEYFVVAFFPVITRCSSFFYLKGVEKQLTLRRKKAWSSEISATS